MMTQVGIDSYDHIRKQNWRNWQWNRIVERLPELRGLHSYSERQARLAASNATVIYLCGPDDFDREAALRKGFRDENLWAVDFNRDHIAKIRKAGKQGVYADLGFLIRAWKESDSIAAIVADFCGGWTERAMKVMHAAYESKAVTADTILSVNMFRGRDPGCMVFKRKANERSEENGNDFMVGAGELRTLIETARKHNRPYLVKIYEAYKETMHRGMMLFSNWWRDCGGDDGRQSRQPIDAMFMPDFYSYESTGNGSTPFDSAVFRVGVPWSIRGRRPEILAEQFREEYGFGTSEESLEIAAGAFASNPGVAEQLKQLGLPIDSTPLSELGDLAASLIRSNPELMKRIKRLGLPIPPSGKECELITKIQSQSSAHRKRIAKTKRQLSAVRAIRTVRMQAATTV